MSPDGPLQGRPPCRERRPKLYRVAVFARLLHLAELPRGGVAHRSRGRQGNTALPSTSAILKQWRGHQVRGVLRARWEERGPGWTAPLEEGFGPGRQNCDALDVMCAAMLPNHRRGKQWRANWQTTKQLLRRESKRNLPKEGNGHAEDEAPFLDHAPAPSLTGETISLPSPPVAGEYLPAAPNRLWLGESASKASLSAAHRQAAVEAQGKLPHRTASGVILFTLSIPQNAAEEVPQGPFC